jgi:hypothetical protein
MENGDQGKDGYRIAKLLQRMGKAKLVEDEASCMRRVK